MLSTRKEKWASLTTKMITDKIMLEAYPTTSKILQGMTMKNHRRQKFSKKAEEKKKMLMHLEMLPASKVQEATSEEVSTINQTKEETQVDLH